MKSLFKTSYVGCVALAVLCCAVMIAVAVTTSTITTTSGNGGKTVTSVDTNVVNVQFNLPARIISLYNAGASTQELYAVKNCTVAQFNTAVANSSATTIRGGNAYLFQGGLPCTNVCFAMKNGDGTADVDVAVQK